MSEIIDLSQFPITPYLEQICSALKNSPSRFLILTAETAAGKSTVLPLALLKNFQGKILMLPIMKAVSNLMRSPKKELELS